MALSEYEKKRLENIKRNKELLQSLEVPNAVRMTSELNKTRTGSPIKKHNPKKEPKAPAAPRRASNRLRNIAAPDIEVTENDNVVKSSEYKAPIIERIDTLNDKDHRNFLKILGNANEEQDEEEDIKVDPSLTPLKEQFDNLRIQHPWASVKMTSEKISQCLFHPGKTKLLVIAASAAGHLSFWDVSNKEEDTEDPVVYSYRPSTKGITNAKFCMNDPTTLYTSSYDGSIQTFDMNTAKFGSLLDSDYPITNFDITHDGQVIYFSTSNGELGIQDLRKKKEIMLELRDKKIGCIHLNPVYTNLMVAASNDRTATIWDIRNMQKDTASPLEELSHGYAVTSAYWSPNGKQLATSSYDDYLRVFDLKESKDKVDLKGKISHNCHTGKWVTMFRTVWNDNKRFGLEHPHFVIGNMKHPASVFSSESMKKIADLYDEERITAIPAVNEFHPTLDSLALVSANASGRVVCWT